MSFLEDENQMVIDAVQIGELQIWYLAIISKVDLISFMI